ncbi:HvfC family RiPP maturation protein [Shewanella gelidii]|uniref:DUF2063 domain-containing protein n=1 Tax=Shewanella gelidii TaxID=1642821 RepID=A0A917N7V9_9GAMM|nr:putative DNA-binding domain-containing protein [Shewanella gelidii]MCL1097519.1 putative DNA-binding domain-containing protein [Shewanella gelidii]GGI75882.1 DUF2063 domain-containing protein [Shewanella gelidii]
MEFKQVQQSFMEHIRDPNKPMPEGVESRRMQIYRDLFFNNIDGFISSGFPVLKSLYRQEDWLVLVRKFFVEHDCKTPVFIEIAEEFLQFLQNEYQPTDVDPVFMLELAHYEWLELVVSVAQTNPHHAPVAPMEVTSVALCLSQNAKIAQYSYEVQHIRADYQPVEPTDSPQFFCIYLDSDEDVKFLQLNPLSAQVLALIEELQVTNFEAIMQWLIESYPTFESHVLEQGCVTLLHQMAQKGILKQSI